MNNQGLKCNGFVVNVFNGQGELILNPSHTIKFMEGRDNILYITLTPFEGHISQIENLIEQGEHAHHTKFSIVLDIVNERGDKTSSIAYEWVTLKSVIYPCFDINKKDEIVQYELEFHYNNKKFVDIKKDKE